MEHGKQEVVSVYGELINMAGGWEKLATKNITSGTSTSLDTGDFALRKFLKWTVFIPSGDDHHGYIYFNGDGTSTGKYTRAGSINSGSRIETANDDEINFTHATDTTKYAEFFCENVEDEEKTILCSYTDSGGSDASTPPNSIEWVFKWVGTDQIKSIKLVCQQTNTSAFPTGTEFTVWGSDGIPVEDEKDNITNVPANTRYEEVDTRKIFRRVAATPNQTKDAGTQSGTGMDTSYAVAKYISGLPAGGTITAVRIGVYNMSGNLKAAVYTTTGSGSGTKPDQKLAETGAESVSISNTNTDVVFDLTSSCEIPSNGIVWVGWFPDGNYKFTGQSGTASYLNSKHGSGVSGASYANAMPQTAWVGTGGDGGNGGNNLRAGVKYTIPARWLERGVAS